MDMNLAQVDTGNSNVLRLRQIFSLARLFDVIQLNLDAYNISELSVLESIDSYEALPSPFYLYAFFLKENQTKMIQTLEPEQLKLMFNLVLLADLIKYNSDTTHFDTESIELSEESKKLIHLVQKEISTTLASYHDLIEQGALP